MRAVHRKFLMAAFVPLALGLMPAGAREAVEARIVDVVGAQTPIELVKDGFEGTEGPLPQADGGILFTENRAGRIVRIAPDGSTSVWMDKTGGANALALMPNGEIVAALTQSPAIGILKQGEEPRILVRDYQGRPFNRPNDIIVGKTGNIYFSDPANPAAAGAEPGVSAVYMLTPAGELTRIADNIERPNGVALSPDERRLYVANTAGDRIISLSLDRQGKVTANNVFARLRMPSNPAAAAQGSGADGMAVDRKGRLYVATTVGVQVFSARGEALGYINTPVAPQNVAFAGRKRNTLYILGRGAVYLVGTETEGPRRAGK